MPNKDNLSTAEIIASTPFKLLNFMIDKKAKEQIGWAKRLQGNIANSDHNNMGGTQHTRTYEERKAMGKEFKSFYVETPITAHSAKDHISTCEYIVQLEHEIGELQRTKLRILSAASDSNDVDFDDGGETYQAVFG